MFIICNQGGEDDISDKGGAVSKVYMQEIEFE